MTSFKERLTDEASRTLTGSYQYGEQLVNLAVRLHETDVDAQSKRILELEADVEQRRTALEKANATIQQLKTRVAHLERILDSTQAAATQKRKR